MTKTFAFFAIFSALFWAGATWCTLALFAVPPTTRDPVALFIGAAVFVVIYFALWFNYGAHTLPGKGE